MPPSRRTEVTEVSPALLRARPLPDSNATSGKHDRGTVLLIGGTRETPGALVLAGLAALRAGAGRLQLATVSSVSTALAIAVPEARVAGLPETADGSIDPHAAGRILELAADSDAVLFGPGTLDEHATAALLAGVLPQLRDARVVLDACAVSALEVEPTLLEQIGQRTILTPNPGEMAALLTRDVDAVRDDPLGSLDDAIERVGCTVALRDAETWIGAVGGERFRDRSGHPALGTSGSGDVLVGFLTGLLARGASPLDATLWAVHCHGVAGATAAAHLAGNGLLAREVIDTLALAVATIAGRGSW
ncbi:MAG: ADP-dependent NAD(P)H-hydrate dehydratase [Acidimicrobiaceae bacterium]|jgi:hydroxyethylthiazole kinase-like uncharacterized protein yjeF